MEQSGAKGIVLNETLVREVAPSGGIRWFIDSMLGYWILLLAISLCAATFIYEIWLKGTLA
jgi:hypothetical protein